MSQAHSRANIFCPSCGSKDINWQRVYHQHSQVCVCRSCQHRFFVDSNQTVAGTDIQDELPALEQANPHSILSEVPENLDQHIESLSFLIQSFGMRISELQSLDLEWPPQGASED